MISAWAQRQEELRSDCVVPPDVFHHMVDRLGEFVTSYQHALETEAGQRNVYLYLQGLLSHLLRKNAEDIATLINVERLVLQEFIGTALWDHRPLVRVLVGQVVEQLGESEGIIAFDPSSFPKRGTHAVGVKRQWCSHRGKVDNCQVGVFMGYVTRARIALPGARRPHGGEQHAGRGWQRCRPWGSEARCETWRTSGKPAHLWSVCL